MWLAIWTIAIDDNKIFLSRFRGLLLMAVSLFLKYMHASPLMCMHILQKTNFQASAVVIEKAQALTTLYRSVQLAQFPGMVCLSSSLLPLT